MWLYIVKQEPLQFNTVGQIKTGPSNCLLLALSTQMKLHTKCHYKIVTPLLAMRQWMWRFWIPFWVQVSWVLCLQSTEQKSCPSLSRNCWFMRLPPHPLQLKQWGQACQWKSPWDSPGESAVMVRLHVLQV